MSSSAESNENYIMTHSAGTKTITAFTQNSYSCVLASDINYTYGVTDSLGQDVTWITFDANTRVVTWQQDPASTPSTYTVTITGTINALSSYSTTTAFTITTTIPTCAESLETITLTAAVPTLVDKAYTQSYA